MKTTITKRILSSVCLTALLLSLIAAVTGCADVSELETSGRTMIYAPSFDGSVNVPTTDAGNVTPDQTEAPVTTAAPKDTVYSFLAAGDNIIHEAVYTDAHKRAENGTGYNFLPMYDGIADLIKDADISFVNQEGPIAGIKYGISGYPNFNAPDEAGQTLVDLGFDIVNIANNHMLDKWESGLLATIDYWETKDVLLLGAYRDQADYDNIRVYTCPDGTSYTGYFADNMKNGTGSFRYASGDVYEGSFTDDMKNGTGTYTWANGEIYEGQFVENRMDGWGTYTWPSGRVLQGNFEDGKFIRTEPII